MKAITTLTTCALLACACCNTVQAASPLQAPVLAMSSTLNVVINRPEIWTDIKLAIMQEEILISYVPSFGRKELHYTLKKGDESTKKYREYLLNILEQGQFWDDRYDLDKGLVIPIGPFFKDGSSLQISFPKSKLKGNYPLECQPYCTRSECSKLFFPSSTSTTQP